MRCLLTPQRTPLHHRSTWTLAGGCIRKCLCAPERFGALLYHFGTRRLSFVKTPTLLRVLEQLAIQRSARTACAAAGVDPDPMPEYAKVLATLAASSMICERA